MRVPLWTRIAAVVFSTCVAGMYLAYATGFHGFIGDIPSGSVPIQPEPISADELPFPKFTEDLLIPSTKSGSLFSPPGDRNASENDVDTTSPSTITIPQAGLPELGLFGPGPAPVIVVPPDVPRLDRNDREFMGSSKFGPIFRPPTEFPPPPIEMTEPKARSN